jgi:uncharacterized protein (DUF58 family)
MSALLWIVGLLGLIWGYSSLWVKQTAGKIELFIRVDERGTTVDEMIEVWTVLENRSWLPVPWVELTQPLPKGLLVQEPDGWAEEIAYRTFLLPRQRVQRRHLIRCERRGLHRLEKAKVQYGDGIGLQDSFAEMFTYATVLVRPRLLDEAELSLRLDELLGERSVLRWYQEDASRPLGVRDYQLGDPFRHIHWAATARTGELMVKQFDTTSETDVHVILNAQFYEPFWAGFIRPLLEHEFRLAATLLTKAGEQGSRFALHTNASSSLVSSLSTPLDSTPSHLDMMITEIGGLAHRAAEPFSDMLQQMRGRLGSGSTVIVLTSHWSPEIALELDHLRAEGHRLILMAYERVAHRLHGLSPAVPIIPVAVKLDEEEAQELETAENTPPQDLATQPASEEVSA